ncbi:MAG: cell division protein ZipA C-terminal FtsZ-binding domain-containing protein [Rhodocyclaceae bacterium]|nr:cell division protein ZipA C-terminal FtsZ-binding domain-containing protein [Rhodocyclaceae bacterium]
MAVSELQIALIGAGAAVVAAVWTYNIWQERQHKKLAEKIFKGGQPDVLLQGQGGEERIEPSARVVDERIEPGVPPLAGEENERVDAPHDVPIVVAEAAAAAADAADAADVFAPPAPAPAPPAAWADDIADCTLRIEFADTVSAPALWAVQAAWAGGLTKPLAWLGYDAQAGQWRRLTPHDAGRYADVAAALQLADRQGPVATDELAVFLDGVHRLSQHFGGAVELPPQDQLLAHAQALDGFCAGVDVQLVVNVVETAGGSFIGTKLRGLAEAAGLALEDDGRFHARDESGAELFALGNLGPESFAAESLKTLAAQGISFVLDVPRAADGPAVFDRMVAAARQMAQALGGTLVDGQRHVLSEPMIAGIRAKVGEIQRQMSANQIPPGSPRALRLFS